MERSELEALTFGKLFVLHQHLSRAADAFFEPLGVTGKQWLLLALLTRGVDRPPTLSEAAALYGTSRQNIKQIASQLEKRGFVEVRADGEDRRALRLHLTDRVSVFEEPQAASTQAEMLHSVFESLDTNDLSDLHQMIETLTSAQATGAPR